MMNSLKLIALFVVVLLGVVGCQGDAANSFDDPATSSRTICLDVAAVSPSTKISFADLGQVGVTLDWALGDEFTIYNSEGSRVGNFVCKSKNESGDTYSFTMTLVDDEEFYDGDYTAIYPSCEESLLDDALSRDITSEQSGDTIASLNDACSMSSQFTFDSSSNTTIYFSHLLSMLTISFEDDGHLPSRLVVNNGDDSYTLNFSEAFLSADQIFTTYLMVAPCEATERTLSCELYESDQSDPFEVRSATTSKAFIAGTRYSVDLSEMNLEELEVQFGGGDGKSEATAFEISTAAQLRKLSDDISLFGSYSGYYIVLTDDIDLGGIDASGSVDEQNAFTPIGNMFHDFGGVFDGGGYQISGLYINSTSTYKALFGSCSGAVIKNLGVSGSVTGLNYVGGIVGLANTTTIINCYNAATVSGSSKVGGVVGSAHSSCTVANCYNIGTVGSTSNSSDGVGGIAGYTFSNTTITNSFNTTSISGGGMVGAVVGDGSMATITNCYYDSTNHKGDGSGDGDGDITSKSTSQMILDSFVTTLNSNVSTYNSTNPTHKAYNWIVQSGSYPLLDM